MYQQQMTFLAIYMVVTIRSIPETIFSLIFFVKLNIKENSSIISFHKNHNNINDLHIHTTNNFCNFNSNTAVLYFLECMSDFHLSNNNTIIKKDALLNYYTNINTLKKQPI